MFRYIVLEKRLIYFSEYDIINKEELIMSIKEGKLLYHLTTLDVFESIVINGLLSRNDLDERQLDFVDTANHEILEGRERLGLSDFIPFHFHIHTSYDTYVKDHNRDKEFIYLCLSRKYAEDNNFPVLPIHPTSQDQPDMYNYLDGIEAIDWDVMEMKKTDPLPFDVTEQQRTLIRMAECLAPSPLPVENFHSVFVKNDQDAQYVRRILLEHNIRINPPYINISDKFF